MIEIYMKRFFYIKFMDLLTIFCFQDIKDF